MIKDTLLSQSKRYMSTLRFGFLILAIFFGSLVQAQQVPLFTQLQSITRGVKIEEAPAGS